MKLIEEIDWEIIEYKINIKNAEEHAVLSIILCFILGNKEEFKVQIS
jgi:hypothetical protein